MAATDSASAPDRWYDSTAGGITSSNDADTCAATEGPEAPIEAAKAAARNAPPARHRPR